MRVTRCTALVLTFTGLFFARPVARVLPPDALPFAKHFLVTGNYVVGSVDLAPHSSSNGMSTGTINMAGVPANADVLAAYVYWETIETNIAQFTGAQFRGLPITVAKATSLPLNPTTAPCWSSGGGSGSTYTMTMFRADVLRLMPIQKDATGKPTGRVLVNDADLTSNNLPLNTISLPDAGSGNNVPSAAGATLFVVYRSPTEPLTSISVYDGIAVQAPGAVMTQTVRGFLQSSASHVSKITHIVGSGAKNSDERVFFKNSLLATNPFAGSNSASSDRFWSSPTYNVTSLMPGTDANDGYGETVTTSVDHTKTTPYDCLSWAAVIFSTTVKDADGDGLPDKLEDTSGMKSPDGKPLPDLHGMGASSQHKDVFIEAGALHADPGTSYGVGAAAEIDSAGHNHLPTPAVLKTLGDSYKSAPIINADGSPGIHVHFDVGPGYHGLGPAYASPDADEFIIDDPAYARGGELIKEVACQDGAAEPCQFPNYPGTVSWKIGYQLYRDAPVDANGLELSAAEMDACDVSGDCRRRFDQNRMNFFHYVLYAHARGKPKEPCLTGTAAQQQTCRDTNPDFHVPSTSSGVSDLPGGDSMVTLGFWGHGFVGAPFIQASTTLHELGHSMWRAHGGDPLPAIEANCKPNYLSVMNYLFQLSGLRDDDGVAHLDYSRDASLTLNKTALSESVVPLPFLTSWYVPFGGALAQAQDASLATRFCSGALLPNPLPAGWVDMARVSVNTQHLADAIDWNGDGLALGVVAGDINFDGTVTAALLHGSNDWLNLRLDQVGSRRNMGGFSNGIDFTGFLDFDGGIDFTGFLDFDGGIDYTGFLDFGGGFDLGSGIDYTGFVDAGGGIDYTGFLDIGGHEIDRQIATASGNVPANEFKTCVLGGTGVDGCAAADGSTPLHRNKTRWIVPDVGDVTSYSVIRVPGALTPSSVKTVVGGSAVPPATTDLVDAAELQHGAQYTYYVRTGFADATKSTSNTKTITAVNDAPVANGAPVVTNEDTAASFTLTATDVDSAGPLVFSIVTPPSHGTLTGTLPNVTYTPDLNYFGTDSFTFKANDKKLPFNPGRDSAPATISITVNPVNDVPSFTKGADKTVNKNAGAQTVLNWATDISPGPANSTPPAVPPASESGQLVNFIIVSNSNTALFSTQPAISPAGTLTFTPATGATGVATIGVAIHDDGGIANGGVDTSATQTFKITVTQTAGPKLTSAGPADVWLGLKNSADAGTKFDVKAEALRNGVVVATGQMNGVTLGSNSATFNSSKAVLKAIQLAESGLPVSLNADDTLSVRVSIRIAATGTTHTSATATLWYNVPPSSGDNGHLHATVGGSTIKYYMVTPLALKANNAGSGPAQSVDVSVDKNVGGNPFVVFGTWTITVQ